MDIAPLRPPPTSRAGSAARGTSRAATPKTAAHAPAHAAHEAAANPDDVALLAQQAAFDRMMEARAELQREANALRDMAMEQVKHDNSAMSAWIKLI